MRDKGDMRTILLIPFFSVLLSACGNQHEAASLTSQAKEQQTPIAPAASITSIKTSPQTPASLTLNGIAQAWSAGPSATLPEPVAQQPVAPLSPRQKKRASAAESPNRLDLVMQSESPTARRITRVRLAGFMSPPPGQNSENSPAGPITAPPSTPETRPGDKAGLRPGDTVLHRGG